MGTPIVPGSPEISVDDMQLDPVNPSKEWEVSYIKLIHRPNIECFIPDKFEYSLATGEGGPLVGELPVMFDLKKR